VTRKLPPALRLHWYSRSFLGVCTTRPPVSVGRLNLGCWHHVTAGSGDGTNLLVFLFHLRNYYSLRIICFHPSDETGTKILARGSRTSTKESHTFSSLFYSCQWRKAPRSKVLISAPSSAVHTLLPKCGSGFPCYTLAIPKFATLSKRNLYLGVSNVVQF